ncbi:MAG TPA: hypothetical protein VJ837_02700 [Candidatus Paceibacterota bacterium]|nr:hypothetical protein [Candidatus Paceibacterota bacterium]
MRTPDTKKSLEQLSLIAAERDERFYQLLKPISLRLATEQIFPPRLRRRFLDRFDFVIQVVARRLQPELFRL